MFNVAKGHINNIKNNATLEELKKIVSFYEQL